MNTIEEQLWDYIDGNLDANETKSIEEKIDANAELKRLHEELLATSLVFAKMELEEPSLSFTRNVMEHVLLETPPIALKTKVNKTIIYSIAAFFGIALVVPLAYVSYHSTFNWPDLNRSLNLKLNINQYFTPTVIYSFLFADLIIALIFLDYLWRKRMLQK